MPVTLASDNDTGTATNWHLALAPGIPEEVRESSTLTMEIEWAGARLRLGLPPDAAAVWLAARMPELDLATLPEPLLATALESMLDEMLAALDRASSAGPARVLNTNAGTSPPLPHSWTLTVRAAESHQLRYATLQADDLALMLLAALVSKAAPVQNTLNLEGIAFPVRALIGHADLTIAEMQELAPRDVVLLDEYLVDPRGELWLSLPVGQGLRIREEASSYIVTQGWTTLSSLASSMTDTPQTESMEQDAPGANLDAENPQSQTATDTDTDDRESSQMNPSDDVHGGAIDMDSIPVRLTFDLGEQHMTLAELRRMQVGETLNLQRPLSDGPVTIRANGAVVGTGDLVDVEGRIGVVIHSLGKGVA